MYRCLSPSPISVSAFAFLVHLLPTSHQWQFQNWSLLFTSLVLLLHQYQSWPIKLNLCLLPMNPPQFSHKTYLPKPINDHPAKMNSRTLLPKKSASHHQPNPHKAMVLKAVQMMENQSRLMRKMMAWFPSHKEKLGGQTMEDITLSLSSAGMSSAIVLWR